MTNKIEKLREIIASPFANEDLPDTHRRILDLHALGYTTPQIAEITGFAEASVRTYRTLGCRKIKTKAHALTQRMMLRIANEVLE